MYIDSTMKRRMSYKICRNLIVLVVTYSIIAPAYSSDMVVYSVDSSVPTPNRSIVNITPEYVNNKTILSRNVDPQLLCFVASSFYEKKYNMPKHILHSISIAESGRWNREHKIQLAWPWVIGIDGKGRFFDTYAEAAVFLRKSIAAGENVDIGCHQVNWKHHGHNFKNPEALLHPKHNAAYAAYFLTQNFNETKDWRKAISHYHSRTPTLGNVYLKKVQAIWNDMRGDKGVQYHEYVKIKSAEIKRVSNGKKLYYTKYHHLNSGSNNSKTLSVEKSAHSNNFKYGKRMNNDMVVFSEKASLPTNTKLVN